MIEVRNLYKNYRRGKKNIPVLKDLSFGVKEGEIFGITGRSGSGKTTLCSLLSGLLPPDSGEILYRGKNMQTFSREDWLAFRREESGIVFQQFNLIPELTLRENLELPLLYAGKSIAQRRERSRELLERLGLEERADHLPAELSGGETQRAALARALANSPKLVFCDEPTAELDEANARLFYRWVENLNREQGITWVIVSHDPLAGEVFQRSLKLD